MTALRAALLLLVLGAGTALAAAPSFQELEESLTCQCGCGLTVHACNHLQCPSAVPLRQEIRSQMALGKSKEQILAYFADKYGEKILSSPTTTGFNVTAWVMPFFAVAIGGLLIGVAAWRWRGRVKTETPAPSEPVDAASAERRRIMERELSDFSD